MGVVARMHFRAGLLGKVMAKMHFRGVVVARIHFRGSQKLLVTFSRSGMTLRPTSAKGPPPFGFPRKAVGPKRAFP